MNKPIILLLIVLMISSCSLNKNNVIESPNGKVRVYFLIIDGRANYTFSYDGTKVILPSLLGYQFKEDGALNDNFKVTEILHSSKDETWEPVWGAFSSIRNHYNEMTSTHGYCVSGL